MNKAMQILYVGDLHRSSKSRMMMITMRELGHAVTAVSIDISDEEGEQVLQRNFFSKVRWKIGFPVDLAGANRAVVTALKQRKYDLLWVTKALMLRPDTLLQSRQLQPSLRLVLYSTDDLAVRHNQSYYLLKSINKYDVIFSTSRFNGQPNELPMLGARKVIKVDFSYDRNHHRPVKLTEAEKQQYSAPVGFIGTFERDRAEQLLYLAKQGIPVRVWGNSWPGSWSRRHPNLIIEGHGLRVHDYVRALCATDINIGFLRKANRDQHTGRSMEIPACGSFLLAERTDDHLRLFEEGREAEFFSTPEELVTKVRYYSAHPEERQHIAAAGRQRCIDSGYSFHDRLPVMLASAMKIE